VRRTERTTPHRRVLRRSRCPPRAAHLGSPVATVAGAHLGASTPNCYSLEFCGGDAEWWADLVDRTGEDGPIIESGHVTLPEGPGLGIEITDDARKYVGEEWEFVF